MWSSGDGNIAEKPIFTHVWFDKPSKPDNYGSTIEYVQFDVNEDNKLNNDNKFKKYVETHFGNNIHGLR